MILDPILDLFRGKAVTIPPLDGALQAEHGARRGEAVRRSGAARQSLQRRRPARLHLGQRASPSSRTAAVVGELRRARCGARRLADRAAWRSALDDGGAVRCRRRDRRCRSCLACPIALAFGAGRRALRAQRLGAAPAVRTGPSTSWRRTPPARVWRVDPGTRRAPGVGTGLAFPCGLLVDAAMRVVVTESWRHRLVRIGRIGGAPSRSSQLPGYPARLPPAADGGSGSALFAPRNRLIEFVLAGGRYRADMMREVPRANWIAPALVVGPQLPRAAAMRRRPHHGHPQAMVADPLLRARRHVSTPICGRSRASTAAPTATPWHDRARSVSRPARSWPPPRAATPSSQQAGGGR